MIKELFESSFFINHPKRDCLNINFIEHPYKGNFSLLDEMACEGCKLICSPDVQDRKQLQVSSKSDVYVMKLDQVFNILNKAGENCDFMMDDSVIMALVEMTCSKSEYVVSKRQKAIGQLYNTLQTICVNKDVKEHIDREKARFVIFSWKDTSLNLPHDAAEESMIVMTEMSDEIYSIDNVSKFDFGFKFKEIRFPDILNWDGLLNVESV
ncbi:MAG: hypothetical protein IKW83_12135 [Muribaculaceae bacterium]|nr:hypothetical protein [Muribaculaceae bacterium]